MICRVYYHYNGRDLTKDVAATLDDAAGVFKHLFPRCTIDRIEEIRHPQARQPGVRRTEAPRRHLMTDEERKTGVAQLRALRERLSQQ